MHSSCSRRRVWYIAASIVTQSGAVAEGGLDSICDLPSGICGAEVMDRPFKLCALSMLLLLLLLLSFLLGSERRLLQPR